MYAKAWGALFLSMNNAPFFLFNEQTFDSLQSVSELHSSPRAKDENSNLN